jgi:hypothetical protein
MIGVRRFAAPLLTEDALRVSVPVQAAMVDETPESDVATLHLGRRPFVAGDRRYRQVTPDRFSAPRKRYRGGKHQTGRPVDADNLGRGVDDRSRVAESGLAIGARSRAVSRSLPEMRCQRLMCRLPPPLTKVGWDLPSGSKSTRVSPPAS